MAKQFIGYLIQFIFYEQKMILYMKNFNKYQLYPPYPLKALEF